MRAEVVAAVTITGVLPVMHHHAVDTRMVGGDIGSRRDRGSCNVVDGAVGVAVVASIPRVRIVAIRAKAPAVDRRARRSIRRPPRAVDAVDRACKCSV